MKRILLGSGLPHRNPFSSMLQEFLESHGAKNCRSDIIWEWGFRDRFILLCSENCFFAKIEGAFHLAIRIIKYLLSVAIRAEN